jgi:hypothetical protein|eukprot:SAG25_NODE_119_length_14756_cov_696.499898_12_plen_53_part_00
MMADDFLEEGQPPSPAGHRPRRDWDRDASTVPTPRQQQQRPQDLYPADHTSE